MTAPRTSRNSFQSLVKTLFYTERIESIEWQDLSPQLHTTADFFEIHLPRWGLCDLLLSSHQTILLEVRLCQCNFCTGPLSFKFASRYRNFGLLRSVPNLIPKICVWVHALLCPLDYVRNPSKIQEDLANGRPHLDCPPSFYYCSGSLRVISWS